MQSLSVSLQTFKHSKCVRPPLPPYNVTEQSVKIDLSDFQVRWMQFVLLCDLLVCLHFSLLLSRPLWIRCECTSVTYQLHSWNTSNACLTLKWVRKTFNAIWKNIYRCLFNFYDTSIIYIKIWKKGIFVNETIIEATASLFSSYFVVFVFCASFIFHSKSQLFIILT